MRVLPLVIPFALCCCQTVVEKPPPVQCPLRASASKPEFLPTPHPVYRNGLERHLANVPPVLVKTRSRDFNNGFVSGVRDAHTIFRNAILASSDGICALLVYEHCPSCPIPPFLENPVELEGRHGEENRPNAVSPESFDAGYHTAVDNRASLFHLDRLPEKVREATYGKCLETRRYLNEQGYTVPKSECNALSQLAFQETWKVIIEALPR